MKMIARSLHALFEKRRALLGDTQAHRYALALLCHSKKGVQQVAAATDKVFYHIFLTCKCFMVINVRWLRSLFYVVARYQSSLLFIS